MSIMKEMKLKIKYWFIARLELAGLDHSLPSTTYN